MKHDDDLCASRQSGRVACLLVSPVAAVLIVPDAVEAKLLSEFERVITTGIIGQDDVIHDLARNFSDGASQGLAGVISRQDHRYSFVIEHQLTPGVWSSQLPAWSNLPAGLQGSIALAGLGCVRAFLNERYRTVLRDSRLTRPLYSPSQ